MKMIYLQVEKSGFSLIQNLSLGLVIQKIIVDKDEEKPLCFTKNIYLIMWNCNLHEMSHLIYYSFITPYIDIKGT